MPVCGTAQRSAGSAITKEWTGNAGTRGRDQAGLGRHQGGTNRQGGAGLGRRRRRSQGGIPPGDNRAARGAEPGGRRPAWLPYRVLPAGRRGGPHRRRPARLAVTAAQHAALGAGRPQGRAAVSVLPGSGTSLTGAETVIDIITDDMPYLVDSVTMELNRHGADILLIVHPVLTVHRDVAGAAHGADAAEADSDAVRESWIHVEVGQVEDNGRLEADLRRVLDDLRVAMEDQRRMRSRRPRPRRAARRRRPGRGRDQRAAGLAGGRALHLPRLPRLRPGR